MKSLGFQRNKYSGELYKFVRETVGDTSTLKYYFAGNVAISFGVDKVSKVIIRCDQPLEIGSVVSNIKDSSGNLVLDTTTWQINTLEPILNSFNAIESYRMRAIKFQGTL